MYGLNNIYYKVIPEGLKKEKYRFHVCHLSFLHVDLVSPLLLLMALKPTQPPV